MDTFILIFILIIVLVLMGLRYLAQHPEWVMRWLMKRAMKQTGFADTAKKQSRSSSRKAYSDARNGAESIIPKEYAEDVSFREEKTLKTNIKEKMAKAKAPTEEQVSDAVWEEI